MWSRMQHGPKSKMSNQEILPPRHCPVPDCPWQVPPQSNKPHASLKEHLITTHGETNPSDYMTTKYCSQHGFHLCQECDTPTTIFTTQGHLRTHITKKHTRSKTNMQLVLTTYRNTTPEIENNWKQSLAFLNQLRPSPPPFRRSIWHKTKPPLRSEFYVTYNNVIKWVLESTPTLAPAILRDHTLPKHDTDSSPFWKLLLLLEPLLLAPIQNTVHLTYSNAFRARLSLLKTGRIEELYNTIWHPTPLPLQPQNRQHKKKRQQKQRLNTHSDGPNLPQWRLTAAQHTADLGNYRAALKRLTTNTPTATLTPPRIARCQTELFPKRRQPPPGTRAQGHTNLPPPTNQYLKLEDNMTELALRQMKPGTASGPFATCTDILAAMALHRTTRAKDATKPYFGNIKALLQLVVTAQVPPPIQTLLASNYFLALHKDITNPEKLRPIGIGTAIRRVAAKTALVHMTDDITPLLLKGGQYGIQIPGGVDFVAQTTAMAVREYIDKHTDNQNTPTDDHNDDQNNTKTATNSPSRALILLDLTNMFNNVSRTEARRILLSEDATCPLVPIFDLLTNHPCDSWYFNENHEPHTLQQEEGFPQGCPLSPLFSCLVLLALTNQLNKEQAKRASTRKQSGDIGDDNKGGVAHTASIMDDTSVCLPHCDLPWFLSRFQELGAPLGIILNHSKTKILTTTTGNTACDTLPRRAQQKVQEALSFLCPEEPERAEITTGVRFLGQPIGSHVFAKQYIRERLDKLVDTMDRISQLQNLQTQHTLYKFSLVASIMHLLPSDITLANPAGDQRSTMWDSDTTRRTDKLTARFLARLTSTRDTDVNETAIIIASLPQRLGGLGYQMASSAAYPRFLTQTVRAIKLASSTDTPIPHVHSRPFLNWEDSTTSTMTKFRKGLSLFAHELADKALYTPSRYDKHTHNSMMNHIMREHAIARLFTITDANQRIFLPSLLSPLTSMVFSLPLTASEFRLENAVFKTAMKRKLRLPVFSQDPNQPAPHSCKCAKKTILDAHGDHLFSCSAASKTPLSNAIRDTLFDVLRQIAPAAKTVDTSLDVHIEPPGLAPQHNRNIRPADVGMLLRQPHRNQHFRYAAIDITVPPPQKPLPILDPSDHENIACMASKTHQDAARDKFCRDPTTAQHLYDNGVYLLPFTVDHLGGLGSFAEHLLFPSEHQPHLFHPGKPPTWDDPHFGKNSLRSSAHPQAFALFQETTHAPANLLTAANKETKRFCYPEAHLYSMGHFAKASLSHAIVTSLAIHVNNHMTAIHQYHTARQKRTTQLQNLSRPFFAPITPIYSPASMEHYMPTAATAPLLCELAA